MEGLFLASEWHVTFLLSAQRFRACKDDRDKVFSILGLVSKEFSSRLQSNYSSTLVQVNCLVVKIWIEIEVHRTLNILGQIMKTEEKTSFPSWCPDWASLRLWHSVSKYPSRDNYVASAQTSTAAEFFEDLMKLTISGFQIDEVAETGVQESDFDFLKDELGLTCKWNLQVIAANISTKLRNHTNLGEQRPAPFFKSRQGNSALEIYWTPW